MLAIIQALEAQRLELEGLTTYIQIVSNYKALEYFITTKSLSSKQARQAKTLLQFNFMLMYKPSSQNQADLLTCRDQEMDSQMAIKISTYIQSLLQPKNLDLQIVIDLDLDPLYICLEIGPIELPNRTYDLINDLLQANCICIDLETLQQQAIDQELSQTVCNRLLLFNNQLIVPKDNELKVHLLSKAYN